MFLVLHLLKKYFFWGPKFIYLQRKIEIKILRWFIGPLGISVQKVLYKMSG